MKTKLLLFIVFNILGHSVLAQTKIDTISDNHKLEIHKGGFYSTYIDGLGNKTYIKYHSNGYGSEVKWLNSTIERYYLIKNDIDHVFKNGYIYSLFLEPICKEQFTEVHGKLLENYLVSKNDSCFLLLKNCQLKFISKLNK